jgi:hypothetical protein
MQKENGKSTIIYFSTCTSSAYRKLILQTGGRLSLLLLCTSLSFEINYYPNDDLKIISSPEFYGDYEFCIIIMNMSEQNPIPSN